MPYTRVVLRPAQAIALGAVTVGLLDAAFATGRSALRGIPFSRVWQGVSAGLLGARAFDGGALTTGLGLALHFFIATSVVLVYYGASRRLPYLAEKPLLWGPLYGLAVFATMNFLVIPLSALSLPHRSFMQLLPGIVIHILGVGLPAAMVVAAVPRVDHPTPAGGVR